MSGAAQTFGILAVDDNEDDIVIIRRTFARARLANKVNYVRSGEEALAYLRHTGAYAETQPPCPGLILLDIAMPRMSGFQVLEQLKADPRLKKIPVVMLTTSDREEDIVRSYEGGACSYITKPVGFEAFAKVIEHFELYWTLVSKVPGSGGA
ncbi:MAG TPA: response regulator [bacterium]|nr:response regulator [bacterium]